MKPLVSDLSSLSRGFGIEVEMVLPVHGSREQVQHMLATILSNNGLPSIARPYDQAPLPDDFVLGVEFDISITPPAVVIEGKRISGIDFAQIELKTKILHSVDEFERIVPLALGICKSLGGKTSGGLHCHVGTDEINADQGEASHTGAHLCTIGRVTPEIERQVEQD